MLIKNWLQNDRLEQWGNVVSLKKTQRHMKSIFAAISHKFKSIQLWWSLTTVSFLICSVLQNLNTFHTSNLQDTDKEKWFSGQICFYKNYEIISENKTKESSKIGTVFIWCLLLWYTQYTPLRRGQRQNAMLWALTRSCTWNQINDIE